MPTYSSCSCDQARGRLASKPPETAEISLGRGATQGLRLTLCRIRGAGFALQFRLASDFSHHRGRRAVPRAFGMRGALQLAYDAATAFGPGPGLPAQQGSRASRRPVRAADSCVRRARHARTHRCTAGRIDTLAATFAAQCAPEPGGFPNLIAHREPILERDVSNDATQQISAALTARELQCRTSGATALD